MNKLMKVLILSVFALGLASAQTILSSTTLSAAITSNSQTTITVASESGMLAPGTTGPVNTVLYVDRELMFVTALPTSTTLTVQRAKGIGAGGRPTAHLSGATVYYANTANGMAAPAYFSQVSWPNENWGSCTSGSEAVLPRIYVYSGAIADCIGSQWTQTNAPGKPTLATGVTIPAGVLTATGTIMTTDTGTAAMTGITVPNGWSPGMCLTFSPGGAFTWTTATNIAASGTAVANKSLFACWNGTKWAMSE